MIGSSLLFGFKGNVKKPKGVRLTLKDVENLEQLTSSYPSWNRDLIAFQILPQCNLQYPVPAIHHLQKLDEYIQTHKENFYTSSLNHNFISHVLRDICDIDILNELTHSKSVSCEGLHESSSHLEPDVSKYALSLAESEASIGFSLARSTQSSVSVSDCFNLSKDVSFRSYNPHCETNVKSSKHRNKKISIYLKSSNDSISSPPKKYSWCVKNWLRKHKDFSTNESVVFNNRLPKLFDITDVQSSPYTSFQLFSSPEKSRENVSNISSSTNLISNLSAVDIVSSPTECDSTRDMLAQNVRSLEKSDRYKSNKRFLTGNQRTLLTLKSNKRNNEIRCSENDNHHVSHSMSNKTADNKVPKELILLKSTGRVFDTTGDRNSESCPSQYLEKTESEDFDESIGASRSQHLPRGLSSDFLETPQRRRNTAHASSEDSDKRRLNYSNMYKHRSNYKKEGTKCHKSVVEMPESEDFDLFMEAAGSGHSQGQWSSDVRDVHQRGKKVSQVLCEESRRDKRISSCSNILKLGFDKRTTKGCESLIEMPESEDFDLFIAAAELSSCDHDMHHNGMKMPKALVSDSVIDKRGLRESNKLKSSFDKNFTKCQKSFIEMPESEDFDLFLAAVNLENVQIEHKSSKISTNIVYNNNIDSEDTGFQILNGKESRDLASQHLVLNSSIRPSQLCREIARSSPELIRNNESSCSLDHFNSSCDLFESPAQPQRSTPILSKEDICNDSEDITGLLDGDQNNSCSLFSPLLSSSQEPNISQTKKICDAHALHRLSHCEDTFMDLFSPGLKPQTPHRQRHSSCNRKRNGLHSSSTNLYCDSPDLFASQDQEY